MCAAAAAAAALCLPNVVETVVGHAMASSLQDAGNLRLVDKLWNASTDALIWETIYMCDSGQVYGPCDRTPFDLPAMLQRRPNLCLYLKNANFEMEGPLLQFRLDLLTKARNLSYLSVSGLELLAAHYAVYPFALPRLRHVRFDVRPERANHREVRRQMKAFLQSLRSVVEVTVFSAPLEGEFFSWSSYDLVNLLDGIVPPQAGIAPRIASFGLLLSPITRCTQRDLATLLKAFQHLRVFRLDMPPEIEIPLLLDVIPDTVEKLKIQCGNATLRGIMEGLADPDKAPGLRMAPWLKVRGIEEGDVLGVESEVIDRALRGLAGRERFRDSERAERMLGRLVIGTDDDDLSVGTISTFDSECGYLFLSHLVCVR